MKNLKVSALIFVSLTLFSYADMKEARKQFWQTVEKAEANYRIKLAQEISQATKVEIFIVSFDKFITEDDWGSSAQSNEDQILIKPYAKATKILKRKTLTATERVTLLKAISSQLQVTEQSGGAMCHMPIHGIRIYREKKRIWENTFCWKCRNCFIDYPNAPTWFETSHAMETLFKKLLPIPTEEIERFEKKYSPRKNTK